MDVFKKDNQDEENDHELFKDCFEIYFILFSDVDFKEPLVLENVKNYETNNFILC